MSSNVGQREVKPESAAAILTRPASKQRKARDNKNQPEQEKILGPSHAFVYFSLDGRAASQCRICC